MLTKSAKNRVCIELLHVTGNRTQTQQVEKSKFNKKYGELA
jgi:hypothetical protein